MSSRMGSSKCRKPVAVNKADDVNGMVALATM